MTYLQETDYPVLSEEGKHLPYEKRAQWDTLWIVDPLDGTKEFIKRNGEFTVNIALVKEGIPVFGVIYVPVKETLYWGELTTGAYKMEGVTGRADRSLEEMKASAFRMPCAETNEVFVIVASRSHLRPKQKSILRKSERYTLMWSWYLWAVPSRFAGFVKDWPMNIPVLPLLWSGTRRPVMP